MTQREPRWTKKALTILKKLYEAGVSLFLIAGQLNRTVSAVKTRAQREGLKRPKTRDKAQIKELKNEAVRMGIRSEIGITNPSALEILVFLATSLVGTRPQFDSACGITASTRNKVITLLENADLIWVDKWSSPEEVGLKLKAFEKWPAIRAEDASSHLVSRPAREQFKAMLDRWLPQISDNQEAIQKLRQFHLRRLDYAISGDISEDDFLSAF